MAKSRSGSHLLKQNPSPKVNKTSKNSLKRGENQILSYLNLKIIDSPKPHHKPVLTEIMKCPNLPATLSKGRGRSL